MREIYDGVRIVELASGIAAPYATMLLADHGAEVIKVEPPEGDPYRAEPGFQTINRGKVSIVAADPYDPDLPVLETADVVVVDRPGLAEAIRARHPGAIVVAMPPWGERGPKVHDPATPDLLAAACGIMWNQQSYGEVPVQLVLPLVAYGTGALGALAISAGVFARERTGAVPIYEVSQVAGAAAIQLGEFYETGLPAERPGYSPLGSKGRVPVYRLFEARDGRWFFLACGTARFYERMVTAIGRPDLIDHPALPAPPWGLLGEGPIEFITPILEEVFAGRPRAHWLALLADADVPCQPVQDRDEFLATSLAKANELAITVEHPELGPVHMMGVPLVIDGAAGRVRAPAPPVGSATPGPHRAPRSGGDQGGPPLTGIRVVDLASFIAGPVISRHLAMLGADVLKVEPPTGDPFRTIGPLFCSWNQGKRSIAIDLQSDDGQRLMHRLVERADVVVENFRPGVAERLGASPSVLRAANPDVVLLSSPGYGVDASMADEPAFDPLLQALGGIMASQGGETEPVFLTVAIHDVVTPLLGAFGIVSSLYDRLRTGHTHHVHTSLAHTTVAVQAAELTRYVGAPPPPVGGFDHGDDGRRLVDGGWQWTDGRHTIAVSQRGLTAEPIAVENGLVVDEVHADWGALTVFGQLIGGAGPPPSRCPGLDEHGADIRAELKP